MNIINKSVHELKSKLNIVIVNKYKCLGMTYSFNSMVFLFIIFIGRDFSKDSGNATMR